MDGQMTKAKLLETLQAKRTAWDTLLADARYDGTRESLRRLEQGTA